MARITTQEIYGMLSLYPKIQVEKESFIEDLLRLKEETLLFIYQGLVEIEEINSTPVSKPPKPSLVVDYLAFTSNPFPYLDLATKQTIFVKRPDGKIVLTLSELIPEK